MFRVMIAGALFAACGTNDGAKVIEHTYDACSPLALVSGSPTDTQSHSMEQAQALWRDRGAPALGRFADMTLEVRFEPAAIEFRGLYDDHASVIYINDAIADESTLAIVIAHELGHAMGLQHVSATKRQSVMNPGNLTTPPTLDDQAALEELWGVCP